MVRTRRVPLAAGLLGMLAAAIVAAAPSSAGVAEPLAVRPVIGKPVTIPARPLPGQRFDVSFRVTRSDTGMPLLRGVMICDPSVSGKVLTHTESFRRGTARMSFLLPANAQGKILRVKVTIRAEGGSATRVSTFRVAQLPTLSIGDASVAEGNAGTTTLSLSVTLSSAAAGRVSVGYATTNGTATAGVDYVAQTGTLAFKAGETTKAIVVDVTADTVAEQDETLAIALTNPVGARIADGTATGTITNDDPRSGHYAGTTSQGRSVAFDVDASGAWLTNFVIFYDWSAVELPLTIANEELNLRGTKIPIAPDGTFRDGASYSDAAGSIVVTITGKLVLPGNASGTFRMDHVLNVSGFGTVHSSTGDVTWTAS